jgi:phage tail-like protein
MPDATARPAPTAAATARQDPYGAYNFKVVIQDVTEAVFTHCTGFGVSIEAIEYGVGADPVVHRLPGRVKYSDVTLRYGITTSQEQELWKWLQAVTNGKVQRRNVSIVVLGNDGAKGVTFNLVNAWPAKWVGAPLDALSNEVAIEELTIVYEMLEKA